MATFHRTQPRPRRALLAAALSSLLAPGVLLAQDEFSLDEPPAPPADPEAIAELTEIRSVVEFGFGVIDDASYRFGRYRGLEDDGAFAIFHLDWYLRAPYDSPDPTYTRLGIRNLGLTTRQVDFEHGRQGDYRVLFTYAQMPSTRIESALTPFRGSQGGALQTLPANWVGAQTTAGMTQLLPSLAPVEIGQERMRVGLGFDKALSGRWDISTRLRHETKQGNKTIGAVFGNSGGNPRAMLLPEPVDYQTREADIALRYGDPTKQLEFRYLVSLFEDGNRALTFQNPYSTISGWAPGTGFPDGFGQIALPPDNQFHQASVAGGYTWAGGLRLTGDVAIGRMTQDEPFLPYTINPVLAASITQPLPRDSLDGRIDTLVANLRLSDRPTERFHWSASWRFDDRDNRTPRDEYVYIGGDSQNQDTGAASSRRRYNEPYSFRESRLRFDAGYRFGRRTYLTGAVEQRDTERTYSEREQADETTFTLNLRHAASDWFSGSLRLVRADRDGSTYHGNEPFLSGYDPGYTGTVPGGWENAPGLRKFHLADRVRDRIAGNVTLTPNEQWSIGLDAQRIVDDYRRSELGLTRSDNDVFTLDVSFVPSARWSSYLFYTHEEMALDQDGQSISGATREADAVNPARAWTARHRDEVDTAGAGFLWQAIEKRLDIGADFVHARSRSQIAMTTGAALLSAPLPADRTRLRSISLYGTYRLRPELSLQLRYWNERYESSDFALDGVAVNQLANVLLLGEQSPDYDVDVLMLSLQYRF